MADGFGRPERDAAEVLIDVALSEDLDEVGDITCQALIDPQRMAKVQVVAREGGILAGGPIAERVFSKFDGSVKWESRIADGAEFSPGGVIAEVHGPLNSLLTGERTALNFLTHLSGVATTTRQFVDAVAGTGAVILDTRKTHPGFRVLEKYAVRMGGGRNHRRGLFDGILIKDNHIAALTEANDVGLTLAEVVRRAKAAAAERPGVSVEIEVDSLDQLRDALRGEPDQVLLDNMGLDELREAVSIRNRTAPQVALEASGGVRLDSVRAIAETGVERISVGALTHSARYIDIGFDWPAV